MYNTWIVPSEEGDAAVLLLMSEHMVRLSHLDIILQSSQQLSGARDCRLVAALRRSISSQLLMVHLAHILQLTSTLSQG